MDNTFRDFLVEKGLINKQVDYVANSNIGDNSLESKEIEKPIILDKLDRFQTNNSLCTDNKANVSIQGNDQVNANIKKQCNISQTSNITKNVSKPSEPILAFSKQKLSPAPISLSVPESNLSNKVKSSQYFHKISDISNQFPYNHSISEIATFQTKQVRKQNIIADAKNKVENKNIIKKIPQKFHKRINIFDQSNYIMKGNGTKQIPTISLSSNHLHKILKSNMNETKSKQNILFFDTFNLKASIHKCQLKSSQNSQSMNGISQQISNYENVQYIICQTSNYQAYFSYLNLNGEYRIIRKILLNSKINKIIFVNDITDQNMTILKNNSNPNQQNRNNNEHKYFGTLYIGCSNGYIYAIKINQQLINGHNKLQIQQENIIQVISDQQRKQNIQIAHILPNIDKNLIYVIMNNNSIKIFNKQQIKTPQSKKQQLNTSKIIEKYTPFEPNIKILTQCSIKILKYIQIYQEDKNSYEKCLLIWTNKLHAPCILNEEQIKIWFPYKLDKLASVFNQIWDEEYFDKPCSEDVQKLNQRLYMKNVVCIDYQSNFNNFVIGCQNGNVYFGSIVCTQPTKLQTNCQNTKIYYDQQEKQKANEFSLSISQSQFSSNSSSSSERENNGNKTDKNPFNFMFLPQFAIQEGTSIKSLALLQNYPYICITTNARIIFYDIQNRKKLTENLKQKENSVANFAKWTINQYLFLCATGMESGKVYVYSDELPIKGNANKNQKSRK